MSKRRLSQRQQSRIRQNQQTAQTTDDSLTALVIAHHGKQVKLELADGSVVDSHIKTNLGNLVCGDQVSAELTSNDEYRIQSLLDRDNLLERLDGFGQARALAANITQLVICLAASPPPNLLLLDQYLLTAEQLGVSAIILLNKSDLAQATQQFNVIHEIYQPLGYPIIETCALSGIGMDHLQAALQHNTSVISGVSGVGKSSITQQLVPDIDIRISEISAANEEGKHTTRTSHLYHLPDGGHLIDTPGIRSFNPAPVKGIPLADGFREIAEQAVHCQFHNCQHLVEPKCAVRSAVESGDISKSRYQHYQKLMEASKS